jgi:hypothetical protein
MRLHKNKTMVWMSGHALWLKNSSSMVRWMDKSVQSLSRGAAFSSSIQNKWFAAGVAALPIISFGRSMLIILTL